MPRTLEIDKQLELVLELLELGSEPELFPLRVHDSIFVSVLIGEILQRPLRRHLFDLGLNAISRFDPSFALAQVALE